MIARAFGPFPQATPWASDSRDHVYRQREELLDAGFVIRLSVGDALGNGTHVATMAGTFGAGDARSLWTDGVAQRLDRV
jgi:hypothetical protein